MSARPGAASLGGGIATSDGLAPDGLCRRRTKPRSAGVWGARASARGSTKFVTVNGGTLDLADPSGWDGDLDAVAHALSHVCRFGGHTRVFSSVAEHSVLVCDLVEARGGGPELMAAGLLHDAHEAFYGDLTTPLKRLLGARYDRLRAAFDRALEDWLGLSVGILHAPEVRAADQLALRMEGAALYAPTWTAPESPAAVTWNGGLSPEDARALFVDRMRALGLGT